MKINLILATDLNGCIGYEDNLVFKSKKDLRRFKELTTNGIVVMGSNTYKSLGYKPLPNRVNIVLSSKLVDNNVQVYSDINVMLDDILKYYPDKTVWIIGGANVYKQFTNIADEVYLTEFEAISDKCDTYFKIDEIYKYFKFNSIEDTFYENDIKTNFIKYLKK
jgi:dihydrofolate reductase